MISKIASNFLVKRSALVASKRNCYPYSHRFVVTPPVERISFAEKAFWGAFFVCGVLAIPAWVVLHIEDYRNGFKNKQKQE